MILCDVPWNSRCDLYVTVTQTQNTWYKSATERKAVLQWRPSHVLFHVLTLPQMSVCILIRYGPSGSTVPITRTLLPADGEKRDTNATRHWMSKTGLSHVAESICSHLQHAKETSCTIWTRHHEDTSFNWRRFFLCSSLLSTWLCAKWSITSTETLL